MRVEIEDTLDQIVSDLVESAKESLVEVIQDNPDVDSWSDLQQKWSYNGADHELVDGAVPIYTKEIKDLWYLHDSKFTEAYRNEGIGDGSEDNYQQSAIFCYLRQQLFEEIESWAEDLVEYVDERRDEIRCEIDELEYQLEDAQDAEDEELINRLEAEIEAWDDEEKLQEFMDELTVDSV